MDLQWEVAIYPGHYHASTVHYHYSQEQFQIDLLQPKDPLHKQKHNDWILPKGVKKQYSRTVSMLTANWRIISCKRVQNWLEGGWYLRCKWHVRLVSLWITMWGIHMHPTLTQARLKHSIHIICMIKNIPPCSTTKYSICCSVVREAPCKYQHLD